jgi:hypothetical protein
MNNQKSQNEKVNRAMAALLEEVLKSGNDAIAKRALQLDQALSRGR